MSDFIEKILRNAKRLSVLESEKLPVGLNDEQVFSLLLSRSEQMQELMRETNRLIDDNLSAVFETPEQLNDAQAAELEAFAEELFSLDNHLDIGLAYPLRQALLKRAEAKGDTDGIIRHLYGVGLIELQWDGHGMTELSAEHFERAAEYKNRYFEIESEQTRMMLNRCIGNVYVATGQKRNMPGRIEPEEFFRAVDRAVSFWYNPKVREKDPDFPWDAFIANSHQNTTSWLDQLREERREDRYLAARVFDSITELYSKEDFFRSPESYHWSNSRTAYAVLSARYHVGLISLETLLDSLKKMIFEVPYGDYSQDAMYRMLHVSAVYIDYLMMGDFDLGHINAEGGRIVELVFEYIKNIPNGFDKRLANSFIGAFAPAAGRINIEKYKHVETVLRLTSFSHLPTYVHSIVVGRLMRVIAGYFIGRQPERFVGILNTKTKKDVEKQKERVLDEIQLAGFAHDVGKSVYINTVALSSRRITDPEFALIRLHPSRGCEFFKNVPDSRCISDVVAGHHKWYDGSRGYPEDFDTAASEFKFVIDIASVADSIDAATDRVGRSYSAGKSLQEVAQEIQEEAGTRYSPVVAGALNDSFLFEQIKWEISQGRKEAYYFAYRDLVERKDVEETG